MIVVSLVQQHSSIGIHFVTVIDSQSWGKDSCEQFPIVRGPLAVGGRIRFAGAYFFLGLEVPDVHLPTQVTESSQANETVEVAPNNFVLVLLAELENNFVLLIEKHRLGRHEPADHQIDLSRLVPGEVVKRSGGSLDFGDFVDFIIVDIESVLAVVGLAGGVVVGLQLDQELVGGGTELDLDLFRLVDVLLIERLILLAVEQQQVPLVALLIQEHGRHQINLFVACPRQLQKLQRPRFDNSNAGSCPVVDLDGFGVVSKTKTVVCSESHQRVAGLQVIVGVGVFLKNQCFCESREIVQSGLSLIRVDLIQHLQEFLIGRETHRVDIPALFLIQQGLLGQGIDDEFDFGRCDQQGSVPGLQEVRGHSEDLLGLLQFLDVGGSDKDSLFGAEDDGGGALIISDGVLPALGRLHCLHIIMKLNSKPTTCELYAHQYTSQFPLLGGFLRLFRGGRRGRGRGLRGTVRTLFHLFIFGVIFRLASKLLDLFDRFFFVFLQLNTGLLRYFWRMIPEIFLVTTGLILYVNTLKITIDDVGLWPFVLVELKFDLLFVHDCPAGTITIGNFVLAFVCVMSILEAALTAHNSRPFRVIFLHFIIDKSHLIYP